MLHFINKIDRFRKLKKKNTSFLDYYRFYLNAQTDTEIVKLVQYSLSTAKWYIPTTSQKYDITFLLVTRYIN